VQLAVSQCRLIDNQCRLVDNLATTGGHWHRRWPSNTPTPRPHPHTTCPPHTHGGTDHDRTSYKGTARTPRPHGVGESSTQRVVGPVVDDRVPTTAAHRQPVTGDPDELGMIQTSWMCWKYQMDGWRSPRTVTQWSGSQHRA